MNKNIRLSCVLLILGLFMFGSAMQSVSCHYEDKCLGMNSFFMFIDEILSNGFCYLIYMVATGVVTYGGLYFLIGYHPGEKLK